MRHFLGTLPAFCIVLLFGCAENQTASITTDTLRNFAATNEVQVKAHWVNRNRVLINTEVDDDVTWNLLSLPEALEGSEITAAIPLAPASTSLPAPKNFPHLEGFKSFMAGAIYPDKHAIISGELFVVGTRKGEVVELSRVQIPGLLDDLYTSGSDDADEVMDYGATVSKAGVNFKLWAPTAKQVQLKLYDDALELQQTTAMKYDDARGVWFLESLQVPAGTYYKYEVTLYHPASQRIETLDVTDPYSLSLSTNSTHSQVVDLNASITKPEGWDTQVIAELDRPEQHIIYEMHIGDFSGTDETVANANRGTYTAFLETESNGIKHLQALKQAGLNTVHFLPTYDLGSINEDKTTRLSLDSSLELVCVMADEAEFCDDPYDPGMNVRALLTSYDPLTGDAQAVIEAIDEIDDYNWGYDPFHYTVPEGIYATDPQGMTRIVEFRAMVQRLHEMGFRVVMDVVYNHTFKAGLDEKSVLDKIVPGYYHRLDPVSGQIANSTCCENTATEHVMMAKLMTDSLVVWARDYKIDGFRFDLMGHQPKQAMLESREAVQAVDPDNYFYGEGWNFGEVANNARFVQATQTELAGTEIGTFTDRLRDAVRGGRFNDVGDGIRQSQGLANGLYTSPNELAPDSAEQLTSYKQEMLIAKLGLAANLKDYTFTGFDQQNVTGQTVLYGEGPAGYASDPADTINYVSKHDNQTLWDNNQYKIAFDHSADDRVRMQMLALSFPMYAQGVPFFHMGSDLLRSKSFLRDSFNYGHWFNAVDFSRQTNNYNVGLPPANKDGDNWQTILKVLEGNEGRDMVSAAQISFVSNVFQDMIAIRASSDLFSLATGEDVQARVSFLNTGLEFEPGLIVMRIDDGAIDEALEDLDPVHEQIIIVFNHSPETKTFALANAGQLQLHPQLVTGADPIVKQSVASADSLTVPAWTTAVFVEPQ